MSRKQQRVVSSTALIKIDIVSAKRSGYRHIRQNHSQCFLQFLSTVRESKRMHKEIMDEMKDLSRRVKDLAAEQKLHREKDDKPEDEEDAA